MNETRKDRLTEPGRRTGPRVALINLGVLAVAVIIVAAFAEPVLRLRYVEPVPPTPPAVLEVQPWLRLDPAAGYTWQPNISPKLGILFHNADVVFEALSTDEFGVENPPEAITARTGGAHVQVLGLGDSFMEMASHRFHTAFAERGTMYYSLAIHRHAPPHYAAMYAAHGVGMKADIVLVGLFENDFAETEDFENWRISGLDWFTYHSGTWCGRTVPATAVGRFARTWLRGYQGLANVIRVRIRGERMSVSGPSAHEVERVTYYLAEISRRAHENGGAFWLVLIPSKPTARGETTAEAQAYDQVVAALGPSGAKVIDLRPVFQAHPDPASLYYRVDGHWNSAGIALAAETILTALGTQPEPSVRSGAAGEKSDEPRSH